MDQLFQETFAKEGYRLAVDLPSQTITRPDGTTIAFEIEDSRKNVLLNGLDDISLTLQNQADIKAFEGGWQQKAPWLFSQRSA